MSLPLILLKTDRRKLLAIDILMTLDKTKHMVERSLRLSVKPTYVIIFDFAFMYNCYYTAHWNT